jgi:hypothetical protein
LISGKINNKIRESKLIREEIKNIMAQFNVRTTGKTSTVSITDIADKERQLIHPCTLDLRQFYTANEISTSSNIQTALNNHNLVATDENGLPIPLSNAVENLQYVKKTIGHPGNTDTDFAWTSAADTVAQNLDLGALIPAKASLIGFMILCDEDVAGGSTLGLAAGTASAGTQIASNTNCDQTTDAPVQIAAGGAPVVAATLAAQHIWIKGTIVSANWSTMTAGAWSVYLTYIDNAALD